MKSTPWKLTVRVLLASSFFTWFCSVVTAAPFYSVREVSDDFMPPKMPDYRSTVDPQTLPDITYIQGAMYPRILHGKPIVTSVNSQGTLIEMFPSGLSQAIPWSFLVYAYATKKPDGSWGGGDILGPANYSGPPIGRLGDVGLNDRNEILLGGDYQTLFDVTTNTRTKIVDLISPDDLAKYVGLSAFALGNDGSIVATYNSEGQMHRILLTPPSCPIESPVPEPGTLAFATLAIIAVGGRSMMSRRRARRS